MKMARSALIVLALGSAGAFGSALAPTMRQIQPAPQLATGRAGSGKGGRRSVTGKLRNWWRPVHATSRRPRDPSDPRQAALINDAQTKRDRRAVKLARDSAKWR